MDKLLTPYETDKLLRYPRGRAVRLARAGKLPAVLLPDGEVRFRAGDLQRIISEAGLAKPDAGQGVRDAK